MSQYLNFPEELRNLRQWVLWKLVIRDGKGTKTPYQVNGNNARSNSPETWSTFQECLDVVSAYDGVGFVFLNSVVGIDLDNCFNQDGTTKDWAREILEQFPSYVERSPSGNGLHLIIKCEDYLESKRLDIDKNTSERIECYSNKHYFTVTGNVFEERDLLRSLDVKPWHEETFGAEVTDYEDQVGIVTLDLPDDDTIKRVMFGAKNGPKIKKLYYGDFQVDYHSQSEADLALVGTLMFYCGNNQVRVDSLFRASGLYRPKWNEKHGKKTYGEMTMNKAISTETMNWKKVPEFILGGKFMIPIINVENMRLAIEGIDSLRGKYRLNDFSHMIEVDNDGVWKNMQDIDVLNATVAISKEFSYFAKVSKDLVADGICLTAYSNRVNPQLEYFTSLVWDEVPRLDSWLHRVFGTPLDELHGAMGANWIKGLVKRVIEPGCVFDEVLVLEGKQGMRKSTAMRVLGNPWHTECTLSTEDKDFYMLLARNVIVEFSEGEIVGRTSAQRLKAVITKTEDMYRLPYEHGMMTFKRSCVFAMTTNNNDYQKDDTGGRRWLPVVLQKEADIEWLRANRDQMFAEALYRLKDFNEPTHEYPWNELTKLQEEKTEEDVYDEPVRDWYDLLPDQRKKLGIKIQEVYDEVIVSDIDYRGVMDRRTEWRMAGILKRILKLSNVVKKLNGKAVRRWVQTVYNTPK